MSRGTDGLLPSGLHALVWRPEGPALKGWRGIGLRAVRTLLVLLRDLFEGQLTLRAMSLVYTTLLSIVPLLALSFSVLKAFGVHDQIQPLLLNLLAPLGEQGAVIARQIGDFIVNINVGVLGAVGLGLLLYTAISLVQKIEESLNHIWHIPQPRQWGERFSRYLTVLMVGPILVFSALGLTAAVLNASIVKRLLEVGLFGQGLQLAGRLAPYALVIFAFAFVYRFIPNTRVRLVPALIGGIVGGVGWQTAGWLFAMFVASSGQYAAIYSGFAILVLFMIWLYLSWLVLLFGASVTFYLQHPEYLVPQIGEPRLSNRMRERIGLAAMVMATSRFAEGEKPITSTGFTQALAVPLHVLQVVLDALCKSGLLVRTADDPPGLTPARDPALISVAQVLDAVRSAGESGFIAPLDAPVPDAVEEALRGMQTAIESALGGTSLQALARRAEPDRADPAL